MKADGTRAARGRSTTRSPRASRFPARPSKIAWSNTHGQYPDLLAEGESVIYTADILYEGGTPRLANKKERHAREGARVHARGAGFPEGRYRADLHLLPVPFADVLGVELARER